MEKSPGKATLASESARSKPDLSEFHRSIPSGVLEFAEDEEIETCLEMCRKLH
jgi:hypothetical protein